MGSSGLEVALVEHELNIGLGDIQLPLERVGTSAQNRE